MMSPEEERELIENVLLQHNWKFAKTMPQFPHWYTLRKEWGDDALFDRVVMYIRRYGYRGVFGRTSYIYLDVGDHKYWTMGSPLNDTILINRDLRKKMVGDEEEIP